jgi:cobalt-zinc-cadmium resistance protein CzcA
MYNEPRPTLEDKVIDISLRQRGMVLMAVAAILGYGVYAYQQMPVDAFPDISPILVPIFIEADGMAPEEIERLITYPIETAMNGLPDVTLVKSTSAFGMAVVYVYFEDGTDIYFARTLVDGRLNSVRSDLPENMDPPTLGPISTGLGQIFIYYLEADETVDAEGKGINLYLRELNDWVVKPQLQSVPGVTEVLSMGGHVLQYQIQVNPLSMQEYRITMEDIITSVNENNRNVGGQFLVLGSEEHLVRGLGLLKDLESIRQIPLKTKEGVVIRIHDVADVEYGPEIRRGVVHRNAESEVVSGIVLKLFGENTSEVIERLYKKVDKVQASLPEGVTLVPYYEQAQLVSQATWTVKKSLLVGAILIVLTLTIFLGDLRSTIIVVLALPISALVAVIFMEQFDISANLMSLGGLAIGIGELGDGATVMVENIFRHLSKPNPKNRSKLEIIHEASREVARPVFFSIVITILVFIPLFALEGVEGKMFKPMAFTLVFALLGSLGMALVVSPVLSAIFLKQREHRELLVMRILKGMYRPALLLALRHRLVLLVLIFSGFITAMVGVSRMGTEFIPTLEEGSIFISVAMAPSISLTEATHTIVELEKIVTEFGEVREVVSRIGRPEAGSHPHPVNYGEVQIELKPYDDWPTYKTKQELVEALNEKLSVVPGVQLNFTQPIQNAFDELLSGTKAQLAIKVYGDDLTVLQELASEVNNAIVDIPGLVDLAVEQSYGQPQVQVQVNREKCSLHGVPANEVLELVELAIGGEVIDHIYLNTRRFGIQLRLKEDARTTPEVIADLQIHAPDGSTLTLGELADIRSVTGPIQINREKNQRRWTVQGNIRGRDLGSVFEDVQERIAERVEFPDGYFVEYGGQFESQQRAMKRLSIIVPLVFLGVFLMLCMSFASIRHASIIIVNIPLALIGGVFGLWVTGQYLSVPASVGFIALFGIAIQNGLVLVGTIRQLQTDGMPLEKALVEAGMLRLRPVLMTQMTTILGLLPLLLSSGIGSEVQRPLAAVVVFGLTTSTILTLFVLPSVYGLFHPKAK